MAAAQLRLTRRAPEIPAQPQNPRNKYISGKFADIIRALATQEELKMTKRLPCPLAAGGGADQSAGRLALRELRTPPRPAQRLHAHRPPPRRRQGQLHLHQPGGAVPAVPSAHSGRLPARPALLGDAPAWARVRGLDKPWDMQAREMIDFATGLLTPAQFERRYGQDHSGTPAQFRERDGTDKKVSPPAEDAEGPNKEKLFHTQTYCSTQVLECNSGIWRSLTNLIVRKFTHKHKEEETC